MSACDLLFHNARIVDVFRLRTFLGWACVAGGRFVAVEEGEPPAGLEAAQRVDVGGRYLAPGLVDAHMHIESSLLTPRRFAQAVLPFGTTTVLADPHEVANVAGVEGVRWMIAASRNLPLSVFVAIPSCVPATSPQIEWTAAVFGADEVRALASEPSVIALGEVMDYRGLLGQNDRLPPMVRAAHEAGLLVEGHIPTLRGVELSRYLAHGVFSDHTLADPPKILEQLSKGVTVMLQTKSVTAENMALLRELPDRANVLLVTDDVEPSRLAGGHLSRVVQLAIERGLPPLEAWASATVRPSRYLRLRDRGAIAPWLRADCMVLDELEAFPPRAVYVGGRQVATEGAYTGEVLPSLPPLPNFPPVPAPPRAKDLRLDRFERVKRVVANVVTLVNEQTTLTQLERVPLELRDGYALFDIGDRLNLVAVRTRDGARTSVGVVKNVNLVRGAFATSLAHDSHNLLLIGRDPRSMETAGRAVQAMGGGVAVAEGDAVLARLPLPLFGLLSDAPLTEVHTALLQVEVMLERFGVRHQRPFLTLSILALSVSPYYKFTDRGVVDTERRVLLPTWEAADG